MLPVVAGLVHQFGAQRSDHGAFVGKVLGCSGAHGGEAVIILYEVEIAVKCAAHLGQIGEHVGQFTQIEAVDGDGDVVFQTIAALAVDL